MAFESSCDSLIIRVLAAMTEIIVLRTFATILARRRKSSSKWYRRVRASGAICSVASYGDPVPARAGTMNVARHVNKLRLSSRIVPEDSRASDACAASFHATLKVCGVHDRVFPGASLEALAANVSFMCATSIESPRSHERQKSAMRSSAGTVWRVLTSIGL